jgi:Zn-dependent peptidase ImmA (M78 family)
LAAICVNDRQATEGAKIFTLFHEYAHLVLRKAGISDENQRNQTESFCNQFAASFLIPKLALRSAVSNFQEQREYSDAEIAQLARKFRVSNRAIALRLEVTGLAPKGFYAQRTAPWDVRQDKPKSPIVREIKIDPVIIRLKRVGRLHADTVLDAVLRHAINSFDASQLVGISQASISKMLAVR